MLVKVIRDLFDEDFTGLLVSGDEAWGTINDYVNSVAPELVPRMSTSTRPPVPMARMCSPCTASTNS